MSSMLEQAIIDAKALKESAIKNAENMIIEKYSDQIKLAVNELLEQDDLEDELASDEEGEQPEQDPSLDGIPLATDEDLPGEDTPVSDTDVISIDLPDLVQQVKQKEEELGVDIDAGESHEELAADLGDAVDAAPEMDSTMAESEEEELNEGEMPKPLADYMKKQKKKKGSGDAEKEEDDSDDDEPSSKSGKMPMEDEPEGKDLNKDGKKGHGKVPAFLKEDEEESLEEEYDVSDEVVEAILEKLKVDIEPQKAGWLNVSDSVMQEYEEMILAREQDDEVKEENEALRAKVKELQETLNKQGATNERLAEENSKFKNALVMLREKVDVVNLSNAKLLYINQTLEHPSLNERQKDKIVEAISKAETPKEAKVMFETLQNTVGSTSRRRTPESLSEAVTNNSSMILNSRRNKKAKKNSDMFSDRMKILAGIKK